MQSTETRIKKIKYSCCTCNFADDKSVAIGVGVAVAFIIVAIVAVLLVVFLYK